VRILAVDPSVAITGAFRCLEQTARLLADEAEFTLVLPPGSQIGAADTHAFQEVVRLPFPNLRKSAGSIVAYGPALAWAGWRLAQLARRTRADCIILNDFYLLQGPIAQRFGYSGRVITWVRFDPARFPGLISRLWLGTAMRASNAVVAVSDFIAARVPASPKVVRIYDGIEPPASRTPGSHRTLEPSHRLVFVGNYIPGKGQDHALAVFRTVLERFPAAELDFYGGDLGQPRTGSIGAVCRTAWKRSVVEQSSATGFHQRSRRRLRRARPSP
jgi:glycosyltransferase involved in cell wall biosynthesis